MKRLIPLVGAVGLAGALFLSGGSSGAQTPTTTTTIACSPGAVHVPGSEACAFIDGVQTTTSTVARPAPTATPVRGTTSLTG